MPIIPQHSFLKKKKKKSFKKLQLADSLQLQSPHLWGLLQVHTDVSLLLSCSQPVAEHGRDTSAGPVLPRAAWPRQSCTASRGSSFLPALLMPVSDLHCGLRLFFFFFVILLIYIYFWLYWVFVAAHRFSLVLGSGLLSSCGEWASHRRGFFCCWAWAPGTRAQLLWHMGLVAGWHVESSGPGVEPMSPALAGGFLTTGLPGKSKALTHYCSLSCSQTSLPGAHYTSYSILVCAFWRLELTWYLQMCAVWVYNFLLIFCWVAVISLRVLGTLDKLPNLCASVSSDVNGK